MVIGGSGNNKNNEEATRRNTRVFPINQISSERHKTIYQDGQKRQSYTKQSIAMRPERISETMSSSLEKIKIP
jgi:hypothetical protein